MELIRFFSLFFALSNAVVINLEHSQVYHRHTCRFFYVTCPFQGYFGVRVEYSKITKRIPVARIQSYKIRNAVAQVGDFMQ